MRLLQHIIILFFVGMSASGPLYAQQCAESHATSVLRANRIGAAIRNGGDFFTDGNAALFQVPFRNSTSETRTGIRSAGLWMGGYDAAGNLYAAAQIDRSSGNDFWAGPLNAITGAIDSLTCERFDQVWQVNMVDVMALWQDYNTNGQVDGPIAPALLLWPGRGNPYYTSQLGFSLPNQDLAPFFDRNGDGIYNPWQGDYPVYEHGNANAVADELIWTVFNDKAATHQVSNTNYLGIEVQLTAWAFNCAQAPGVLRDVVFTRHRIINRSNTDYINFRTGLHIDFELGCADDDYVGTDSALNSFYVYNADYTDGAAGCIGASHGQNPPVIAVTFLNQALAKTIYNVNSNLSPLGYPSGVNAGQGFYRLLSGTWADGTALSYGGTGLDTLNPLLCNFAFPNYPSDTASNKWWADAAFSWAQGQDFRMIGSVLEDTLRAGEIFDLDAAYSYHYDANITGLYNMLQLLPQRIPQIQQAYNGGFSQPACQSATDFDADVVGHVFWDANEDCGLNANEQAMGNVVIRATRTSDNLTRYATSDSLGNYNFIALPFGQYEFEAIPPAPYWLDACVSGGVHDVTLVHPLQSDTLVFALRDAVLCSFLEVDVSTPILRQCADNIYNVNYCNNGTDTAVNVTVDVLLDPHLRLDSSSIATTPFGSSLYRFSVGDLAPGACGSFDFHAFLSCDSAALGQTHCVNAHIKPDSLCINVWNGPIFSVEGSCMGDSVQFRIINIGMTLANPVRVRLIVIEDIIMYPPLDIDVIGTQPTIITVPVQAGATYRASVLQPAGIPSLSADPLASSFVEGCGVDSLEQIHVGYVNMFSNGGGTPYRAVDCQESQVTTALRGPLLFLEKRAFPVGYSLRNYIFAEDAIDYQVRLVDANVNNLIVRDTLSPHLDISSFEPGASSHPYTWRIYGEGILEFKFDNIQLPPTRINDIFIKYRLHQKPLNPSGTVIESRAEVIINSSQGIMTNPVFHEVAGDFITLLSLINSAEQATSRLNLRIVPNPVGSEASFVIDSEKAYSKLSIGIFDAMGRLVWEQAATGGNMPIFERGSLPAGIYFFRLLGDGKPLQSGTLLLK